MPEPPFPPKAREHPHRRTSVRADPPLPQNPEAEAGDASESAVAPHQSWAELQVTSNFTFLTGASHPEELVETAAALGYTAIAITDLHSLAGIVRAWITARDLGVTLLIGARIEPVDGPGLLLHATDLASYARLSRLLTVGRGRAPKGSCELTLHDIFAHADGLLATVLTPPDIAINGDDLARLAALRDVFDDDRLSLGVSVRHDGRDEERLALLDRLADATGIPLVALGDVFYHEPMRRALHDVVTCIRLGCSLDEAGTRLLPHAERHLAPRSRLHRLFGAIPHAIDRTLVLARRASAFDLGQIRYRYPKADVPDGMSAADHLRSLVLTGGRERYPGPDGIPPAVLERIDHELELIRDLAYEPYFLTVHDIVHFARSRSILCQGRGAAANSAVCYCLGLTSVDPDRVQLLFERFISRERDEPPDIDIDFEHERREEVIQYIYQRYGRDRAALTATVISYRSRSAIREVGKVFGMSLDVIEALTGNLDWWSKEIADTEKIRGLGLDPENATLRRMMAIARELIGFPRHLSQHVGGFVITEGPLCEIVPIENASMEDRTVIEWDKDDIDAMGILKIDVLGLGMLTCVRKCFDLIERHEDRAISLTTVPPEDPAVYDMICAADTVGVFQIESRAQMSMLPRLRPRCWYDLVIEVAIVRPGPIHGDMVHPYLRRRQGLEPVTYPSDAVRHVLERTLGVPLFQEQAMSLAVVAAGFTLDEADQLRRAMAAWKRKGNLMVKFGRKLVEGMIERGYERSFADRVFRQLEGFSEYGFPESHAASFALIVYASCWLKHHHPAVFLAGILNSQPMGFYQPAQLVRDAKEHGVEVRPVDVNFSGWDCRLESVPMHGVTGRPDTRHAPVRLGMRQVKGLARDDADRVDRAVRERGPFHSIASMWRTSGVSVGALRKLARADAFRSMRITRQQAQWAIQKLRDDPLPLFEPEVTPVDMGCEIEVSRGRNESSESTEWLPPVRAIDRVIDDYDATSLTLRDHPVAFIRAELESMGAVPCAELRDEKQWPRGKPVQVAGIVLVRQRPGTASGTMFMTLEDESGVANLIVRPKVYERDRAAGRHSVVLHARGRVEREGSVVHIMVESMKSLDTMMGELRMKSRDFH